MAAYKSPGVVQLGSPCVCSALVFTLPLRVGVASGVALGRAVTNTQNNARLVTFCKQRSYRDFLLLPRASFAGEFLCVFAATEFGVPESG